MPKRASIPQGKALFFRPSEAAGGETGPVPVPVEEALAPSAPEHAPRQKPPTRQSAIFLEEQHIDWLEDRCREARRNGGRAIRKAAVIRALLDVAMESGIDLTALRREDDLLPRVRQALRG